MSGNKIRMGARTKGALRNILPLKAHCSPLSRAPLVSEDLLTPCYGSDGKPFASIYAKHAPAEILNPTTNFTYEFFKAFFQEVRDVFVDEYLHLGMDEVYYDCWRSNPDVKDFMKTNGMRNISEVEQYYVKRTLKNVKDIGYKYMTWQDPVDNGVKVN